MGVRGRTVLLLLGAALFLWAVLQTAGILLGDRVSNQIDQRTAQAGASRAVSQIEESAQQLTLVTADWALWDDAYAFMRDRNAAFVQTNLSPETLSSLHVDFMVFADKSGRIVTSKAIDPATRRTTALPAGLARYLTPELAGLGLTDPTVAEAAAADLPGGPLLIAVQPISSTRGTAPYDGYFVTGYSLAGDRLASLRKLVTLPLNIRPAGGTQTPPSASTATATVIGYGVVNGLDGSPALVAEVTQPRAAFDMTRATVLSAGMGLGVLGLLLVVGLGLTLDTIVLPDHLRAQQSKMILDIAREAMDNLHEGLMPGAAGTVARLVLQHSPADTVVITDCARVLGYAGLGSDHHKVGGPIVMAATQEALATNTRKILRRRSEIGCPNERCPLQAAILVPLRIGGAPAGMLEFFFTSSRKLDRTSMALADGLAPLLSMQLELDRSQSDLTYLASHDALTGLANRRQFETELGRELSKQRRLGGTGALLWFDLDHFKDLNDCLGHAAGDEILRAFAEQLRASTRDYCTVARLGGDEFGILVPHVDEHDARATAARLLFALGGAPFAIAGHKVRVSASVGLVRFPEHGTDCDQLMARADLAMYEAKTTGGNRFVAYTHDEQWQSRMTEQIATSEHIVSALRDNRFRLYAQPVLDLSDDKVHSYELLVRMIDEDGEAIPPSVFIPTAERLGMIRDIDRWVARRAIGMLAEEQAAGRHTFFAINLSGAAFSDPDLLQIMREEFRLLGVRPSDLVIEITETTAIADIQRAQEFIEALREIGCRFALDDFGSGTSSFYYLKHLAVDYLKIDGELVKGLSGGSPDLHFVRAIVEMCRGLGIRTVAEYVESEELLGVVRGEGVDFAQGYEIGRPLPLEEYMGAATSDARSPSSATSHPGIRPEPVPRP